MNLSDFYQFSQLKAVHHDSGLWVFIPKFINLNSLLYVCYETVMNPSLTKIWCLS